MSNISLTDDQKPWLALYPPDLAAEFTPELGDALSVFRSCVAERPDHPAIKYFDKTMSYQDVDSAADALACFLQDVGVGRGDRVAIALQNSPEFVLMCVAAWKIAAVPLPVNPMYRRPELAKIFADAEPAALLCEDVDAAEMRGGLTDGGQQSCSMVLTNAKAFGLAFDFPRSASTAEPVLDLPKLAEVLEAYAGRRADRLTPAPGDLGLLLYTSGTTGVPKGAMIHHRSLASNAQLLRDWCNLNGGSRIWALAPFFHITGFICHVLASFSAKATLVMHYRFDPKLALDVIRSARPTFAIGAITAFNALMNVPGVRREDFESFDRIYSGGAPIPPALVEAFAEKFGVQIHPSYGMTETTAPTHLTPFGALAPVDPTSGALSVGIPAPSTEAAVMDDNGAPLGPGEIGELVMRGRQIMAGYWRKPDETAAVLKDGWMHSGDVGFRDEAGWFYLVDRKKDVIIASGFKVWPREVEDTLYTHPAVREAAVVGVPDTYRGETVKAYVSLVAGAGVEPSDLVEHCRERLAAYKVPRLIEVLDELPKTVTGKIQRAALR